jgi:hypothetical protein
VVKLTRPDDKRQRSPEAVADQSRGREFGERLRRLPRRPRLLSVASLALVPFVGVIRRRFVRTRKRVIARADIPRDDALARRGEEPLAPRRADCYPERLAVPRFDARRLGDVLLERRGRRRGRAAENARVLRAERGNAVFHVRGVLELPEASARVPHAHVVTRPLRDQRIDRARCLRRAREDATAQRAELEQERGVGRGGPPGLRVAP